MNRKSSFFPNEFQNSFPELSVKAGYFIMSFRSHKPVNMTSRLLQLRLINFLTKSSSLANLCVNLSLRLVPVMISYCDQHAQKTNNNE